MNKLLLIEQPTPDRLEGADIEYRAQYYPSLLVLNFCRVTVGVRSGRCKLRLEYSEPSWLLGSVTRHECRSIGSEPYGRFAEEMEAVVPEQLASSSGIGLDGGGIGLDGASFDCAVFKTGASHLFSTDSFSWNPSHRRFLIAMHRLASSVVGRSRSRKLLAALQGYLD